MTEFAGSVVIITHDRVEFLRTCLDALMAQSRPPSEIIVVDSSPTTQTEDLLRDFPAATYVRNPSGYGNMPAARNLGTESATGEICLFIDDDAEPYPDWYEHLMAAFTDPDIAGAGGRAVNPSVSPPMGDFEIGRLRPDGMLTANFDADIAGIREVDHLIGCNMAFRKAVLIDGGGFNKRLTGPVRDETELCLRLRGAGHKLVYVPSAVVIHVGAPQPHGRRFGYRYALYTGRNHAYMLGSIFGVRDSRLWRYLVSSARFRRQGLGANARIIVQVAGAVIGIAMALRQAPAGHPGRSSESGR